MRVPVMRRAACALMAGLFLSAAPAAQAPVTAIRAGRLLDPEAGRILTNQVILVEGTRIREVGPNVAIPAGAQVIDLSKMTVMPGLVDAHNHLALTYKPVPENNVYYYTYVQESTALRAIQAASNGIQMLASGFTIVRDMGNNGNYADTALRQAIEQGWIPGPDDHQLRHHHRRHGRAVLPDARDGEGPQHRLSRSISTPTRRTRSSRRSARTCCSARR